MRIEIPVNQTIVVDGYPYQAVLSMNPDSCELCAFHGLEYCKPFSCNRKCRLDKASIHFIPSTLKIY